MCLLLIVLISMLPVLIQYECYKPFLRDNCNAVSGKGNFNAKAKLLKCFIVKPVQKRVMSALNRSLTYVSIFLITKENVWPNVT